MAESVVGNHVPTLALPASNGENIALTDFKGKKVVLYFYPKDMTPGCTTEACDFRDLHSTFEEYNTIIIGVSPDPIKSHQKFIEKHELPFILLADEEHELAEFFGVWTLKKMYGREFMGIERSTFVINEEGEIVKEWRKVRVKNHVQEVQSFLSQRL